MRYSRDVCNLWDMLNAARRVVEWVAGRDLGEYQADEIRRLAVERMLQILGEAARRISAELKQANPQIPWVMITGLRNVLTHEYDRIRDDIIVELISADLPQVIAELEKLVPEEPTE